MTARAALKFIEQQLRTIATTPEACGLTAEAPLFAVLTLLEVRAALTGSPAPRPAYEALLREQWGTTSYHASHYLGVGRIGGFLTTLLDRTLTEADSRHGGSPGSAPEASAVPSEPPAVPAGQGTLPGLAPPVKVRRRSQHRFGLLRRVTVPATELVPEHEVALETCRHCDVQRRRANTGVRLGARLTYSKDGETWSGVSPPCIPKR